MAPQRFHVAVRVAAVVLAGLWTAEATASRYFTHIAAFASEKFWTDDDQDCDGPTAGSRGGPVSIFAGEDPAEKTTLITRLGETGWTWSNFPSSPLPSAARLQAAFESSPSEPIHLDGFPVQALAPPVA